MKMGEINEVAQRVLKGPAKLEKRLAAVEEQVTEPELEKSETGKAPGA